MYSNRSWADGSSSRLKFQALFCRAAGWSSFCSWRQFRLHESVVSSILCWPGAFHLESVEAHKLMKYVYTFQWVRRYLIQSSSSAPHECESGESITPVEGLAVFDGCQRKWHEACFQKNAPSSGSAGVTHCFLGGAALLVFRFIIARKYLENQHKKLYPDLWKICEIFDYPLRRLASCTGTSRSVLARQI